MVWIFYNIALTETPVGSWNRNLEHVFIRGERLEAPHDYETIPLWNNNK